MAVGERQVKNNHYKHASEQRGRGEEEVGYKCCHESAYLHSNLTAQGQAVSPTAGEPHATDTASDVSRRDLLTVCRYGQRSFARRSSVLPDVTGSILDLSL